MAHTSSGAIATTLSMRADAIPGTGDQVVPSKCNSPRPTAGASQTSFSPDPVTSVPPGTPERGRRRNEVVAPSP